MEEKKKPSKCRPKGGPYLLCRGKKVLEEIADICLAIDRLKEEGPPATLTSKDGTLIAWCAKPYITRSRP